MAKRSTALAVSDGRNRRRAGSERAEKLPTGESVILPAALLLAAEAVAASKDDGREVLQGVHLHRRDDLVRIVATDGIRMFISSLKVSGTLPAWLDDEGIILSGDGLKARVGMICKMQDEPVVTISFAKGQAKASVSDNLGAAVFQMAVIAEEYVDYEAFLQASSFINLDEWGNKSGVEWEPIGINSLYLKQIGEIAKTLEAGLPKERRTKGGMVVRSYNGGAPNAPLVFDFSTWPGTLLVILPAKLATPVISKETSLLLAPAVRGTVAALRAHATRWLQRAQDATGDDEKEAALAKAAGFQERVAEVLKRAPGVPAISDQSEPVVEPEPEGGEPGPTFEEGEGERPADGDELEDDEAEDGEAELQVAAE